MTKNSESLCPECMMIQAFALDGILTYISNLDYPVRALLSVSISTYINPNTKIGNCSNGLLPYSKSQPVTLLDYAKQEPRETGSRANHPASPGSPV